MGEGEIGFSFLSSGFKYASTFSFLKGLLSNKIDELSKEVSSLEDEYNTCLINIQNPIPFMQDFNDNNRKKASEISKLLQQLEADFENT